MVVLAVAGQPNDSAEALGFVAAGLPLLWSLSALAGPGTGRWWRWRLGGREPSPREREAYELARGDAAQLGSKVRAPHSWFVVDEAEPRAAVRGQTLMLTRGLLAMPADLDGVLAHELGHLNTLDGRLIEALNRLTLWHDPVEPGLEYRDYFEASDGRAGLLSFGLGRLIRWLVRGLVCLAGGGLSLLLLRPVWGAYWRDRKYAADRYAAELGAVDDLARYLEAHALFFDLPVAFLWLSDQAHPPVELRLGRLTDP